MKPITSVGDPKGIFTLVKPSQKMTAIQCSKFPESFPLLHHSDKFLDPLLSVTFTDVLINMTDICRQ